MDSDKLEHFKNKLINEKENINKIILEMKKNETIDSKSEIASELSFYDNHPSDLASEFNDIARGMAFRKNEEDLLNKINGALERIENNEYGVCQICGKPISEERLSFVPYAENCINCQNKLNDSKPREKNDRAPEEDVLGYPFYDGNLRSGFDLEDSYEKVQEFDKIEKCDEFNDDDSEDEGYVEPIEKISNLQYKNQLPD
ncbi:MULTISPECIES: TraR/DksA C4-type zinc finger protein [Clostridium]|uniref:TraR/DksA C4-type zinc finger protein n=1 Tax=Clostridium TaxID=1485 RepID=UPI0008271E77|nr:MULTISPECIES: TraR/DksA C4-type zinc finger protein [Clostridium]PJI09907.1 molecular chaperone DnaK [Clostridium sp. CT7]